MSSEVVKTPKFDYTRECVWCKGPMPTSADGERRTCSTECGKAFAANKGRRKIDSTEIAAAKVMTPAMREFRELMEKDDDYVRELLQEVVRDSVTQVVQDNVVGAAEVITSLLPEALASVAKDLKSKDWNIRKTARSEVLKYAMLFKDKDGSDDDLGTIQVVHQVSLPDTPIGHRVAEELEVDDHDDSVEAFEQGWPVCIHCGERKHPDAMRYKGSHGTATCSSCFLSHQLKIDRGHEIEGYDDDAS